MIVLPNTEKTHDCIFIHLDKTTDCDGRTDRQTESLQRTVKRILILLNISVQWAT